MVGCHSITLMASIHQPSDTAPVQLLQGETEKAGDCPLDIIIDLMVRASEGERRGGKGRGGKERKVHRQERGDVEGEIDDRMNEER